MTFKNADPIDIGAIAKQHITMLARQHGATLPGDFQQAEQDRILATMRAKTQRLYPTPTPDEEALQEPKIAPTDLIMGRILAKAGAKLGQLGAENIPAMMARNLPVIQEALRFAIPQSTLPITGNSRRTNVPSW